MNKYCKCGFINLVSKNSCVKCGKPIRHDIVIKLKFKDGHEYDFSKHPTLQNLSKENIKEVMNKLKE